jgi:hypothetical protein
MAADVASQLSTHFAPGLPCESAARRWELSADDRGDAAPVSLRGEADSRCASAPQSCLTGIRWRPRPAADQFAAVRCR